MLGRLLGEDVAGARVLELRDGADVARAQLVDRVHLLAPRRGELADPLLRAARGVDQVRVRAQHARLDAEEVDPPRVGVGGRLEDVGEDWRVLLGRDVGLRVVGAQRVDRAAHRGRGQVLEERLEQAVRAEVLGRDAAGDGKEVALGDALLERGDDLFV